MTEKIQLCVFDMQRGLEEGQELDKILFFSPSDCPLPSQLSLIGLSEGLITFTRIFSPETPCEMMEAEQRTHIFHQCEKDVWMVMVVEKNKDVKEAPREAALRAVLEEAHDLLSLFYGPIRALVDADPDGGVARSYLHTFFRDYFSDVVAGKKFRLPTVADSLTEKRLVQFYLPRPQLLLEALSFQGLFKSWFGGRTVQHVLLLFQNIVLSTTLPPVDTTRLFLYATLKMVPSSLSQAARPNSSARGHTPTSSTDSSNSSLHSSLFHLFSTLSTGISAGERVDPPSASSNGAALDDQGQRKGVPRPLAQEAWWRGEDGFLDTDAWDAGGETAHDFPEVWLQSSGEWMRLCVYQCKSLTVVMLVPASSGPGIITSIKGQLLDKAAQKLEKLEDNLVKEWPGVNASHIPGYRYLYCDWEHKTSRFSPASKVATLSKESLASLNRIRGEVDLETGRLERAASMPDREFELCLRTKQNAWVTVRSQGGHVLYTILEKSSNTLLLASEAVEKLNKWYFKGLLSSD